MRIGITLQSLDPTWGGIGIYTEEIVKHLLKYDKEDEYILIYPGFGVPRKSFGRYQRKNKNVTEVETAFSRIPLGSYWDQFVIPKIANKYKIDVIFNPFLSIPIFGSFKKVMIMHAVEYHTVPKVYNLNLYIKWFFLEKALMPTADRVISISHVMTHDISKTTKYPIEKVRTIYHGVSDKFRVIHEKKHLADLREEYQLPEQFILFVGHLYPQKNFANLVRAFHLIDEKIPHDLVVVGRPRWKYQSDLSLIESLGIGHRIHFLHYVPPSDLPAIYNMASCFAYPSLYEAFGLVQLEAMACGCPVIAARAGAIPEIAGGAALLFDPYDPQELAQLILNVITDQELHEDMVDKGLRRAKEFSWDRCALETLRVLKEVVEE